MKILTLSSFDLTGGAGKAAFRLSQALRDSGVDLQMEVQSRSGDAFWVTESTKGLNKVANRLRPTLDRLPLRLYPSYSGASWSSNLLPRRVNLATRNFSAQLVHLHWIGYGFIPISALCKFALPIVWTLHDSWTFTGGCHVPGDCRQYMDNCGHCPQLGSHSQFDLSRLVLRCKAAYWRNLNLCLVAPSRWLASTARQSSLFHEREIHVIPNGLDLQLFRPLDPLQCRKLLNLPLDKKLIVFGAVSPFGDSNKGCDHLRLAIDRLALAKDQANFELVIFGPRSTQDTLFALPSHYVGQIRDELTMAILLSAADVTVVPSRSENLSNIIMESLACGTPVACFDIGGNSDMVDHLDNGYLARPYDAADLAKGIRWITHSEEHTVNLRQNARSKCVKEFAIEDVAQRYLKLYETVIATSKPI